MTSDIKRKIVKITYCIYLILLICFIFGNSMSSIDESAEQSTAILDAVNNLVESVGLPFKFEHIFIRKTAHIIEFVTLGASLFGFLVLNKKVKSENCVYCAFFCCLVAMTDETIQFFCERGSMVVDVWLDFVSAVVGISISYLIYYFICKKTDRFSNSMEQSECVIPSSAS